jgi:hypothetical protein
MMEVLRLGQTLDLGFRLTSSEMIGLDWMISILHVLKVEMLRTR